MLERGQFAFPAIFKPPESERDTTLFRLNAARLFTCVPPCPGRFDGPRYEAIRNSLANFVFAHCAASIVSYFLDSTSFSLLELRKGSFIQQLRIFGQCCLDSNRVVKLYFLRNSVLKEFKCFKGI